MSTRNRGSYSSYSGRRSGGASLLRTFGLVLLLGAFSFLLGFFVLSRFVPGGRGPGIQSAVVPGGDDSPHRGNTEASVPAPPVRQIEPPAVNPPARSASTAAHAPDPVPSIDPAEDEKTQQPANLDGTASSGDADKPSSEAGSAGNGGANSSPTLEAASPAPDASTTHHRRKRRRRRTAPSTAAPADAQSTASQPEKQTPPEEATQPPTNLDDSGASKTDQGKSGDNKSDNNN